MLLLLLVMANKLYAQEHQRDTIKSDTVSRPVFTLQGRIVGGEKQEILPGAYIYLGEKKVAVATTNQEGIFILPKLPAARIQLSVSYIGYKLFSKTYELTSDLNIGKICLQPIVLEEVIVKAVPPLAIQRGDTTEFNAGALKIAVDADLEDLLKKLPGFQIVDGKIIVQGKEVTKLYIDGMEYSFNDPAAALKNLPAKLVAKIKMYDDQSEEAKFSGFDDGKKFRSLNIVTHAPDKKKIFGYGTAGYGITDPLKNTFKEKNYQLSLSSNLFDQKRKITVSGNVQNTGQSNELPGSRYQGKGGNNIFQTYYANFSSKLGKKVMFSGNYDLNRGKSYSASLSKQEYFPTERYESRIYGSENHNWGTRSNQALNIRLKYEINEKNNISFSPVLSMGRDQSHSLRLSENIENKDTINNSNTTDYNKGKNFRAGGDLMWMHAFAKKGRTFTMRWNGSYNRNLSDQFQNNKERSLNDENIPTDTLRNLLIANHRTGYNWSAFIAWGEPLTERARLGISYSYRESADHSDKKSLSYRDKEFEELIGIDTVQTNMLENQYQVHNYGVNYNYHKKKFTLNGGFTISHTRMENCYRYLGKSDSLVRSTYMDLFPQINMGIETQKNANLNISYQGSSSSPTAVQLQDILDVANPLQVSKGNPELKKSYQHNLSLDYNRAFPKKSAFLYWSFLGGQTFNQIVSNLKFIQRDTVINDYALSRGARLSIPVNLNGNWNMGMNINYSFPWKKLKLRLNTSLSYRFTHTPSIYDDLKNITRAHTGDLNVNLITDISEDFNASLFASSAYSHSRNTTTGGAQYFNENLHVGVSWIFWKGFYIGGNYSGGFYITKKEEKVNQSQHMLDLRIGKKFGKNRQIDVSLSANDVLHQQNALNYSLNDLYTETSYHTISSSFYMFSFSYRFNSMNKSDKEPVGF